MEESILKNVRKIVGIGDYDPGFDQDLILQINSAFSVLHDLGIGPADGFTIEDDQATWEQFLPPSDPPNDTIRNLAKTCVFLRVRLVFDPPQTSYLLAAMEKQLEEHEWRINRMRESTQWADPDPTVVVGVPE